MVVFGAKQQDIAIADLDLDGIADLVVTMEVNKSVGIALGLGGGAFSPAAFYPVLALSGHPTALAVEDVSGDGILDVVTVTPTRSRISLQRGVGDGTLLAPTHRMTGTTAGRSARRRR